MMNGHIPNDINGHSNSHINGNTNGTTQPKTRSQAGIVGAGIAGLSAAIALQRAGWDVEIFERSQFRSEVGAAISVTPNATHILDDWGFDFDQTQPVENLQIRMVLAPNLAPLWTEQYPDIKQEFGHQSWSFHRVDLHKGLKNLFSEGAKGSASKLRLGSEVIRVDFATGLIELKDGTTHQKDLVVIADGAHSHLVEQFTGTPDAVVDSGRSAYRWLVPMEHIKSDTDTEALLKDELPGFHGIVEPRKNVFLINYTCRGDTLLNVVVVHDTLRREGEQDLWHSPATKEQVLSQMEHFHPSVRKLVDLADKDGIKVHHLMRRPAMSTFVKGRTLLVGDAAHVMLPTHAAGGAVSIESAAAIEVLFRDLADPSTINNTIMSQRLKLFDQLRVPRCNMTMLLSNAGPPGLEVPGVEDEIRKYYQGPLPPPGTKPWQKPLREVMFRYDAHREAEDALRKVTG